MLLDLHDKLSLRNWEQALFKFPYRVDEGWSKKLRKEGLVIDFSRVGWVEPVALVRAVLLTEGALLNGTDVTIRLPLARPSKAEAAILNAAEGSKNQPLQSKAANVAKFIGRRRQASGVLRHMRIREALLHHHIKSASGTLRIIEDYDWSIQKNFKADYPQSNDLNVAPIEDRKIPWYFKVAYGLQWLPDPRTEKGRELLDHLSEVDVLTEVLTPKSGRISAADGRTLAHVFIKELVENAIDHSGREFALVAAWSRPAEVNLKNIEVLECERRFATWCNGYPLVEIIVGDSGEGIPSTLRKEYRLKHHDDPGSLMDASENDRILAWAFDKWSTRFSGNQKRGTRGLYRVARIVRKYDGCITVRSELSYVGLDCGSYDPPDYIYEKARLTRSPGTIAHARLPIMLSEKLPERPSEPALCQSKFIVLDFYGLDWNKQPETIKLVSQRVFEASTIGTSSREPVCLIADLGYASIERRVLEELLRELVQIAHPVAIVVANVKGPGWDSSIETIHSLAEQVTSDAFHETTAEQPDALNVRDALLFLHADGSFAWVGVTEQVSEYLNHLWKKGELSSTELQNYISDREERNYILRQFAEAYHVVYRLPHGGISLKFNQQDVYEQLCAHVAEQMNKKVQQELPPIVWSGTYRTPSLALVSKFIDVEKLLVAVGMERATGALAWKCTKLSQLWETSGTIEILSDWRTSREILETFRSSLSTILQRSSSAIEISQVGPDELPVIRDNSIVILFTDIILTGDIVVWLLSQVIRARRVPIAVIAIIDARTNTEGALDALGYSLEVLSLSQINISTPENLNEEGAINISPINHKPEVDIASVTYEYPITPSELDSMIEQNDALYFNHIVRPNGRHFCFYLDAFKLLGALDTADQSDISQTGKDVIQAFDDAIDRWLEGRAIDFICFPYLSRSERPSVAEIIAKKLGQKYNAEVVALSSIGEITFVPSVKHTPIDIQQTQPSLFEEFNPSESNTESDKRTTAEKQEPKTAIIIDWGSITGKNVRDSIRFAATQGASQILAVIFLSQLPTDDERFLTNINTVRFNKQVKDCKVSVRFLSRFPIQSYDALHCPYCRQLIRLNEEERYFLSDLLEGFIEDARYRHRRRYLPEVREDRGKIQITVEQNEFSRLFDPEFNITRIARFRAQLEKAKEWTSERHALFEELVRLEENTRGGINQASLERGCLIRLLATEWVWLKQEPLSLFGFKRQIAKLATDTIKDTKRPEQERLDAIVVLRTASKEAFAQSLCDLFKLVLEDETLVSQLLYCAFTYLQRDYLMTETLRPLVEALSCCARVVSELIALPDQIAALRTGQTVNALEQYGRYLLRPRAELSAPEAWIHLKEAIGGPTYHVHHPVCVAFDALRFGPLEADITDPFATPPEINWPEKRKRWEQTCVPFIIETVLPLLKPLRVVFEGLDARVKVGRSNAEALALFAKGKGFQEISALSHELAVFASRPDAVRQPSDWKAFTQAREWVWRLIIDPGEFQADGSRLGGSALVRVVEGCPTDLLTIIKAILENELYSQTLSFTFNNLASEHAWAFCHNDVLRESLSELLNNVINHIEVYDKSHSRIPVELKLFSDDRRIHLQIMNQGTVREINSRGHGLVTCKERLRPYNADINKVEKPAAPWTFGVKVSFQKG